MDIGNGVLLEKVVLLLKRLLDANEGCNSAMMARVSSARNKFSEYLPIVPGKGF